MRVRNLKRIVELSLKTKTPFKPSIFFGIVGERTVRRGVRLLEAKNILTVEKKGLGINKGVSLLVTEKDDEKLKELLKRLNSLKKVNLKGVI